MPTGRNAPWSRGLSYLALAATMVLSLSACDPCTGVVSCSDDPLVRYEGEIILKFTGEPGRNIPVMFVRTGGAALADDSVRTTTDSLGRFAIELVPSSAERIEGDLVVLTPGSDPNGVVAPARISVNLTPSQARSDVRFLGRLPVPHLYFGNYGELYYRGGPLYASDGVFARNVEVELRRTGGIRITPDPYLVRTDGAAQFPIEPQPLEHGELTFDLIVRPPEPYQPVTLAGLRMSTRFSERPSRGLIVQAGIGPHLPYVGALFYADTKQPAAGTEVEFRRTGGIRLAQDTYRTVVNSFATFNLGPVPLESGVVIADLTVRPPSPYPTFVIRGVRLQTTEEDTQNVPAGRWEVPAN